MASPDKEGFSTLGKLGSLKIVPVPPGHEHEPDEMCANFDLKGEVYVREEDWASSHDFASASRRGRTARVFSQSRSYVEAGP